MHNLKSVRLFLVEMSTFPKFRLKKIHLPFSIPDREMKPGDTENEKDKDLPAKK